MKTIRIIILAAMLCAGPAARAQEPADTSATLGTLFSPQANAPQTAADPTEMWNMANSAYMSGDFNAAIDLYNNILETGKHSARLYYNLGNAYFKANRLGQAILNYNRAQLLDPGNDDTAYNLALANARAVDKIEGVPEFFLSKWIRSIGLTFNSNTWTAIGLALLAVTLAAVILWLVSRSMPMRKTGFYGAVIAALLCIISFAYAQSARARQTESRYAIVMNIAAPVKSSPSSTSKDIFILHEGTKVQVYETLDGWCEISIADGNKGWIQETAIELIE